MCVISGETCFHTNLLVPLSIILETGENENKLGIKGSIPSVTTFPH